MTIQKNQTINQQQLSLLLPSKGRYLDLILTLLFTKVVSSSAYQVKFIICANYNALQLALLRFLFSSKAEIIDERKQPAGSMIGAYNLAFDYAKIYKSTWVALWADDLLPASRIWLIDLLHEISKPNFQFGIFSSDEGGHKNQYGWNIFAGYPCAHFYVARVDVLPGYLLNPKLKAYVGDNEIVIDRVKSNIEVKLLSVQVVHQPTINTTRKRNSQAYEADLHTVYSIHPELKGRLDSVVLEGDLRTQDTGFILDEGNTVIFNEQCSPLNFDEFSRHAKPVTHRIMVRIVGKIRVVWNKMVLITEVLINKIA